MPGVSKTLERNELILRAYEANEPMESITARFALTRQRIKKIIDFAKAQRRGKQVHA